MDAPPTAEAPGTMLEWIRKRDGEVLRLDPTKLSQSLVHANEDLVEPLSSDVIGELAEMALFFVRSNAGGPVTTDEVADWVEKGLRQTGNRSLADSFGRYRQRKAWARASLAIRGDIQPGSRSEGDAVEVWDKSEIVQDLRARLNLDTGRARAIASRVERFVIRGRFEQLTRDWIRETVNAELSRWGEPQRLGASGEIRISTAQLRRELSDSGGLSGARWRVTRRVWRDYSLHEIVSRDVADAERRGLIYVHGLEAPSCLSATCIDCGALVRQSKGSRQSMAHFGARLAQASDSCSRLLALDRIECWLSLVAEPSDTPAKLAEQFWHELSSRVRHAALPCVLNLYGGMPQEGDVELGAGPLFSQQPLSAEREFAGAVAQELLDLVRRDAANWPTLRLDWHWYAMPDPVQTVLAARVVRVVEEGGGRFVTVAFDRQPIPLGEGLRRVRGVIRPVLDYVGIHLPVLWRDAGSPRSLSAIEQGVRQAAELAVRAAVQRREFMRRLPSSAEPTALDSAVLAIYPVGLDYTARQLVGKGAAEEEGALKLCESLVRFLRDAAAREARPFGLGVVLDHPIDIDRERPRQLEDAGLEEGSAAAGLVPVGGSLGLRRRIQAAGRLHAIAQAGTLTHEWKAGAGHMMPERDGYGSHQPLGETLDWAARQTELVRLHFTPPPPGDDRSNVLWSES
jgi:hypothetical protein